MHCPTCGKSADVEQQFCRACGMSLETVGKLVAEHTSMPVEQRKVIQAEREKEMVGKMFNWILWGMMILGVGVVILLVDKTFDIGAWLKFVSTLLILGGSGVIVGGVLHTFKQGIGLTGIKPMNQITGSADTKSLPTGRIPASVPSVTERTTQLLPTEDARSNNVIDSNGRE